MKVRQTITAVIAFLLSLLMLVSVANLAAAQTTNTSQFVLDRVEIDNSLYTVDQTVLVTRGESMVFELFFHGTGVGTNDARASVEIVGAEFDDVRARTTLFEILPGVHDSKKLTLQIPADLRASDDYKVRVMLEDDDTAGFTQIYSVRVEEERHLLNTFDVIVNPPSRVQPGQPLFVTVRVENMGASVEESAKVTVSIPALGVQASEFVDVLDTEANSRDNLDNDVRAAATTNDLLLMIPESAQPGEYLMNVVLQYNRFHNQQQKVVPIVVEGTATGTQPKSIVSVDAVTQRTEVGKGVVYKVSVANLEGVAQTYSVMVNGVGSWGSYRVDPLTRTLQPDQTGEFNVFVSPVEGATAGTQTFTVNVQDATGKVVGQQTLNLEVGSATKTGSEAVRRALEVGFVALLVILVILGIVIVAKRLASDEDEEEQRPTGRVAKKSYY